MNGVAHQFNPIQQGRTAASDRGCDSAERSAVRTFDSLAAKARAMCPAEPVHFTCLDWDLPRLVGDQVVIGRTVHGNKRLTLRLAADKVFREAEAVLLLRDRPATPAPAHASRLVPVHLARKPVVRLSEAQARDAFDRYTSGAASRLELAAEFDVSPCTIALRVKALDPTRAATASRLWHRYRYRSGAERAALIAAAMAKHFPADGPRAPILKSTGRIL